LNRWWATARCLRAGAFAADLADLMQLAYRAPIRPDAHGVFTDHLPDEPGEPGHLDKSGLATVPFFLEHDTGTEPLAVLTRKIDGYQRLARQTGHRWPVLFWLHSSTRERHLHEHLAHDPRPTVPVATAARDRTEDLNPADAIWWLHAGARAEVGSRWRRLVELPATPFTGDAPSERHDNPAGVVL
jgi:hypothetical protein